MRALVSMLAVAPRDINILAAEASPTVGYKAGYKAGLGHWFYLVSDNLIQNIRERFTLYLIKGLSDFQLSKNTISPSIHLY